MASSLKITRKYWQQKSQRVLVDQHRPNRTEWRSLFKALTRDFAAHAMVLDEIGLEEPPTGDRADPRELLIWAWVALKAMPFGTAQDYPRLKEDEATDGSLPRLVREARRTKFVFRGLHDALDLQLKWTAALVRAADEALSGVSLWPADPLSWRSAHWTPPGYPCFVIPVHREYRMEEGKSRERRAARHHAVVPTRVGSLDVEIRLHPGAAGKPEHSPERMQYGAALFEGMTVDVKKVGSDSFLLKGAPAPEEERQIEGHLSGSRNDRCDVVAWPELSMPVERLDLLKDKLDGTLFSGSHRIPIVAAGSWHVESDGAHVNRMEVLDGRGVKLLDVDKRVKFTMLADDGPRVEAIEPGEKVPLLVTKNRLIGFAICRDWCEDCDPNVFREISADLVVLPSMGGRETVDAHQRHAKAVQSVQGSVLFAVQQMPVLEGAAAGADEPLGYSFALPLSRGDGGQPPPDEQYVPFRALRARI